ncbi:MAG: hypothetical protein ABJF04_00235 [Reichenbachiella sp.]|uniref:hypothetical protein n=1 Tax=Reichenbachiella sp. TaxID=2184521 RepID=UPI0032633A1A
MMKIKTLLLILTLTGSTHLMAVSEPEYATAETREVVLKMIEAHGGLEKWRNSKSFSFQNIMFSSSLGERPFWINEVTVDPKTRRVYQNWLSHDATMASDGNETWSENWKIGNAPKFEALFFYYFLNLPWLTQDSNVTLSEAKKIKHDSFENEVYVIEMGFSEKPAMGKTKNDTYKLYIDAESYLLVGYEYSIGYGYMLDLFGFPPEKNLFGPMFRINDSFTAIDGLIYPNLMHTGNTDMTKVYGNHAIVKYSLDNKFDNSRMKKSSNSIVDTSSDKRKKI